jgi:hypothetical protein
MFGNSIQGGFIGNAAGNLLNSMGNTEKRLENQLGRVGGTLNASELNRIKEKLNISGGVRAMARDKGIKIFGGGGGEQLGNVAGMIEQLHPNDPKYHAIPNSAEDVYATSFGVRNWNLRS